MGELTVSVIIPCFNSIKFIDETINSVLNQTYKNFNIIAIDDGSTDNTRNTLENYKNKLTIATHQHFRNKGVAASLNLGLQMTSSDLIAFIDHDDLWHPDKLKRQVELFEANSNVDLVYSNGVRIDKFGKTINYIFDQSHSEPNDLNRLFLSNYIITCSNVMITRRIVDKVGYFNENLLAADHDMWLRIMEVSRFSYIPEYLISYRIHSNNSFYKRKIWEDGFVYLNEACKRHPYDADLICKRRAELHYRLGLHDYRVARNNIKSSVHNFIMMLRYDPVFPFKKTINYFKAYLTNFKWR